MNGALQRIRTNADYFFGFKLKYANGAYVPFAGCSIRIDFRKSQYLTSALLQHLQSTTFASADALVAGGNAGIWIDAVNNVFWVFIPKSTTTTYKWQHAYYDVLLTDSNGIEKSVPGMSGIVEIEQGVTAA